MCQPKLRKLKMTVKFLFDNYILQNFSKFDLKRALERNTFCLCSRVTVWLLHVFLDGDTKLFSLSFVYFSSEKKNLKKNL